MLIIIHGWSDSHKSFAKLGERLVADKLTSDIKHVRLGDYVSLDDDVTFEDLTAALQQAWQREGLPTKPRSVDVVVHSTGGLIIRHWMVSNYSPATNPVNRLLMLAPANFGSPLAHKGRSFIGRVVKGFKSERLFQTGKHILKGLELASPFTWNLANLDRFGEDAWYGPGRILCTVLVGNSGYTGISAAANSNGTDGTVRVSTASLNPMKITFNFSDDERYPRLSLKEANGVTAFARISEENHSTIALKDGGPKNEYTYELIKKALKVTDETFMSYALELEAFSEKERIKGAGDPFTQSYQNTVVKLTDSTGAYVADYFFEAFAKKNGGAGGRGGGGDVDNQLTRLIQERILDKVHAYGDNEAYRSLLFNTTILNKEVIKPNHPLFFSVTATPDINKTKTVGYSTFGYNDIGSIKLIPEELQKIFLPDRTVLIDIIIKRKQEDRVFKFYPLV